MIFTKNNQKLDIFLRGSFICRNVDHSLERVLFIFICAQLYGIMFYISVCESVGFVSTSNCEIVMNEKDFPRVSI